MAEIPIFDKTIYNTLSSLLVKLEMLLQADNFLYFGEINPIFKKFFVDAIENLASKKQYNRLAFHIKTPGGSAEAVEVMVEIMRHHYEEIYFIVADSAYSAGTILCMSGDKIYMDYSSSLGPIDPQIYSNGKLVPVQGYLDQFEALLNKSKEGIISPLEMQMIRDISLGDLNYFLQARNLTVTLLTKWLVNYKFKNWNFHKNGRVVTLDEKKLRAEEIAKLLGNNSYWHSHGRHIGLKTLRDVLHLEIEDYGENKELASLIKDYNTLAEEFQMKQGWPCFMHSRCII